MPAPSDIIFGSGLWSIRAHKDGTWVWSTGDLGNGWAAVVRDESQSGFVRTQETWYLAKAYSSDYESVLHQQRIEELAEAKCIALQLALGQ